jgi:dynein heavy chain
MKSIILIYRYYSEFERRVYVTPTSFLELIKTFKTILERKKIELITQKERYIIGLDKLEMAQKNLVHLKAELTELQPILKKTSDETEELINIIEKEAGEVDAVKQIVEADTEQANRTTMEAQAIKDECEDQLEMVIPALNEALNALNTLKPQDISCKSKKLFQVLESVKLFFILGSRFSILELQVTF